VGEAAVAEQRRAAQAGHLGQGRGSGRGGGGRPGSVEGAGRLRREAAMAQGAAHGWLQRGALEEGYYPRRAGPVAAGATAGAHSVTFPVTRGGALGARSLGARGVKVLAHPLHKVRARSRSTASVSPPPGAEPS